MQFPICPLKETWWTHLTITPIPWSIHWFLPPQHRQFLIWPRRDGPSNHIASLQDIKIFNQKVPCPHLAHFPQFHLDPMHYLMSFCTFVISWGRPPINLDCFGSTRIVLHTILIQQSPLTNYQTIHHPLFLPPPPRLILAQCSLHHGCFQICLPIYWWSGWLPGTTRSLAVRLTI